MSTSGSAAAGWLEVERWEADRPERPSRHDSLVQRPADERAPMPAPAAPALPGPPKTFYVIEGCYAGDRPPRQDSLPAGCRVEDVRKVEPN
jgi:hypothetical protein